MRYYATLLLLLIAPLAEAANAPWPQIEGKTFDNDTGAELKARMCDVDGLSNCGPVMTFAAGRTNINCGYWIFGTPGPIKDANGNTIWPRRCFIVADAPPPPPPPPPPVTVPPPGVAFLAAAGQLFKVTVATDVKMCKNNVSNCSTKTIRFPASKGESWFCNTTHFPEGGEACFSVPPTKFSCFPPVGEVNYLSRTSSNFQRKDVPAAVSANRFWYWKDTCTNLFTGSLATPGDEAAFAAAFVKDWFADKFGGNVDKDAAFNAWVREQPIAPYTAAESAWVKTTLDELNKPAPAVQYVVQQVSSTVVGDRPVYRLNADGARNKTAVSGKRAPGYTPCNADKHADGNYYEVPSVGAGLYAVCVLKP